MKTRISVALVLLAMSGCHEGKAPAQARASEAKGVLTVATVRAKDLGSKEYVEVSGLLFAAQDVAVMASVPGDVAKVLANEGDFVKKGEPLAMLDQEEFRLAVAQAEHQLEAAKLAVKQLELDFGRNKALHDSGSVSDSQLEQLGLKLDLARNQLAMAKDGLAMANKKLRDTVIRAPFDCYVTNRLVSLGSHITAMPPTVLFRVVDLAHLEFKAQLPDVLLSHVVKGDKALIRFDAIGREVEARVDEVVSSVDPRSMTCTVIVRLDNAALDYALKPGMMGVAKVFGKNLEHTYLVEKRYLKQLDLTGGKGTLLLARGGQAKAHDVGLERLDDLRVRITSGLSDEDLVVISAVESLQDGQQIETR